MACAIDEIIKRPWRTMKAKHFGGEEVPLHAADLRDPTSDQPEALNAYFWQNRFGRFAVTMTKATVLPAGPKPYDVIPDVVRHRWEQFLARCTPAPVEVALLHEESERGDALVQRYFGETVVMLNGTRLPVHHGFMPKNVGDEAQEIADFIVQAAGGQALARMKGHTGIRKDFEAIFHANPIWSSFHGIESVEVNRPDVA